MQMAGEQVNALMMLAVVLGAVGGGILGSHGLTFLFNNLPDRFFDDPRAHIGTGDERFQRITVGQGQSIFAVVLSFLFMSMGMVDWRYALVGALGIFMVLFAIVSLWKYGEIPEAIPTGVLLCGLGTAPFHAGGADMLMGAVSCGVGIGFGALAMQRLAKRSTRVLRSVTLAAAVGMNVGFLLGTGIMIIAYFHGILMEWAMSVNARSAGYDGMSEETMRKVISKGDAAFMSTRWRLLHFGRAPLLMGFCLLSVFAFVIYPLVFEITRGLFPWT